MTRMLITLIIFSFLKTVYMCVTTENKYAKSGDTVKLQFQAVTTHRENSALLAINVVKSPNTSTLLTVIYKDGSTNTADPTCNGCTFVGDTNMGNISIRIDNLQTENAGTYKNSVLSPAEDIKCISIRILGVPEKSVITPDNNNVVGLEKKLNCSSISTTKPPDSNLELHYTWAVDNPDENRYEYSKYNETLTIKHLMKSDFKNRFTCKATESGNGIVGETSLSSNEFVLVFIYGPDTVTTTLSPADLSYVKKEGDHLGDITCNGDCYPSCTYKWTKSGSRWMVSSHTLSLRQLTRDENATYTCTVINANRTEMTISKTVTVIVKYGPDANTTVLSPSYPSYNKTEGEILQNVTCSGSCVPSCGYKWTKPGATGAVTVSSNQVLSLGLLNRSEAAYYTCTVSNSETGQNQTKQITVNVIYGPDSHTTTLLPTPTQYALAEGTILPNITCVGDCFPACSYKWTKPGNKEVARGHILSLGTLTREHATNYTCEVTNTLKDGFVAKTVIVNVTYRPDVSIISSTNEYVEGKSITLTCKAKGNPATYTYNGFKQTFGDSTINNKHSFISGTLHIPSLRLQDTGNYTCYVNNGVELPTGELKDSTNSIFVGVQVRPKILTDQLRFAGETGNTALVQLKLYSFPYKNKATFIRYDGLTVTDDSRYEIDLFETVVEMNFYSTYVSLEGSFLNMSITDVQEDDFGNYTLVLENEIGTTNETIFLDAESVPSEPKYFVYSYKDSIHQFSWTGGFNGGHFQTFEIQTSIAGLDNWVNQTTVSENERNQYLANISSISPGTYIARIFAWNIRGSSKYIVLNETFKIEEEEVISGDMSAVIGGVAGGSAALIIVGILVVILKRRGFFSKDKARAHDDKNERKPVYEDENDDGMQDNPMYVSAGPRHPEHKAGVSGVSDAGAVYSTVEKKRPVVDSSKSDVYAEVVRSKKTKMNKGKKKKEMSGHGFVKNKKGAKFIQEGDVYENATTIELKGKQKKNDEIIYENPEPSKSTDKKNVNRDGLIYADLTFNDQPKGQKKLVIHGLDSMTEYVQVDFTKKADPLPDSDDENNPPKK